jgi:hypothetical protein
MARAQSTFRQQPSRADLRLRRSRPEDIIQRAVFEHLRLRCAPGVYAFHVPNGGARSPIEGAILKGLGVRAGVPDVIVVKDGRTYALEIKSPGGRLTAAQNDAHAALRAAGVTVVTCFSLDDSCAVGALGPAAWASFDTPMNRAPRIPDREDVAPYIVATGGVWAQLPERVRR